MQLSNEEMTLIETILIAVVMLLGTEGVDYLIFERELDEWKRMGWLWRN